MSSNISPADANHPTNSNTDDKDTTIHSATTGAEGGQAQVVSSSAASQNPERKGSLELSRSPKPEQAGGASTPLDEDGVPLNTTESAQDTKEEMVTERVDDEATDCTICHEPLTKPCTLYPCSHAFHSPCIWEWFEGRGEVILRRYRSAHHPTHPQIFICPLCGQRVITLTEAPWGQDLNSSYVAGPLVTRQNSELFLRVLSIWDQKYDLKNDSPLSDHALLRWNNVEVGHGWGLCFGVGDEEDCIFCPGYNNTIITVPELLRRFKARGFPPFKGYEGEPKRGRERETVGDLRRYGDYVEKLIIRNLPKDRQLNFGRQNDELYDLDDVAPDFEGWKPARED